MKLKDHEKVLLLRMYDKAIIGMGYRSLETVESSIHWSEIQEKFRVKKKFRSVVQHLGNLGILTGKKKSYKITSIDPDFTFSVKANLQEWKALDLR